MKKYALTAVIVILGLGGIGYFVYKDLGLNLGSLSGTATSTPTNATSSDSYYVDTPDGRLLVEKEAVAQIPSPSLDRPYAAPKELPADLKADTLKKYNEIVATLKADPQLVQSWIVLGTYRKQSGDYQGAEEVWLYVTKVSPSYYLSYANLGDLYDFYLKDYSKAEKNYLAAVNAKADYIAGYRSLHDLYKDRYQKTTSKAEDILKQGITKNPKNLDLLIPLALYYKEKGKGDLAKQYFLEARAEAQTLGKTSLVAGIDEELASIK